MLLSVGVNDFRVPEGNTLTMYSALQRMNVPARLLIWPDENHWILKGENSRVFYREVRAWLEKYLLPACAADRGDGPSVTDDAAAAAESKTIRPAPRCSRGRSSRSSCRW